MVKYLLGVAVVALRCAAAAEQLDVVSVTTPLGRFIGSSNSSLFDAEVNGGVESFVGVKYAKVPTRFERVSFLDHACLSCPHI